MKTILSLSLLLWIAARAASAVEPVAYHVQLDVISDGFDGKFCWFHPRAGAIPGDSPTVVLTMQRWRLAASDVFYPVASQWTRDFGKTWSPIVEHTSTLGRRPLPNGYDEGICDFTPKWHATTRTLLGTGQTVEYDEHDKLVQVRPRSPVWSTYDAGKQTWSPWAKLELPDEPRFNSAGAGSTQRVDLDDGTILLPIYSKEMHDKAYFTTVAHCAFDGKTLRYLGHGTELTVPAVRGLYEPSLAKFGRKFFLTMRNDDAAYVAVSDDGQNFGEPRKWTFDDGADLGSYNTQAHWVTHSDGLFLTYTRRGANNDNVVRHRAPLFLAQVDPERLVVLRSTEREIVPNKGAQLGNFAVVDVNEHETWVTTSEGMAPGDPRKFGANGRVYAARIQWAKPNTVWDRH
ncbi:MAG TPA: exo-alpha-sialidase [Chthoniobacter sp.]|jgi:hypothetical protein